MILKHVNIIDINKGQIKQAENIFIENGKITRINNKDPIKSNEIIDVKYKFVLPGLIDLHVHVSEEPETELAKQFHFDEPEANSIKRMKRNLNQALLAGITSLRDVGSFEGRGLLAKKLVKSGAIVGPRIFTCGHSLTPPGGHWFERSREVADNPVSMKTAVEKEIKKGADFIKIMIEIPTFFSIETIKAAVVTAHKLNKKISAHAAYPKSIKLAIEAGIDTLEHTGNIPDNLLQLAIKQAMVIIPTYFSAFISVKNPDEAMLFDTDSSIPGTQQDVYLLFIKWLKLLDKGLPELFKSKIKIGAGTDAGFPLVHFFSVIKELQLLNQLGLETNRCLQSATTIAAGVLGKEKELGSVEAGKTADLIVVNNNPLIDLRELENVKLVIKEGKIIKNNL